MKFFKTAVLLLIIASAFATSLKRVERTLSKSKTKNDGSGSWDSGYECPGFLMASGNAQFARGQYVGKGSFQAKLLSQPILQENINGWVFDLKTMAPTGDLKKMMVQIKDSTQWYLPYRWLRSGITYTNPLLGDKFLEGWAVNDNQESFHWRLNLPYKLIGWYLTDKEGHKLVELLQRNMHIQQDLIRNTKVHASAAATDYLRNTTLLSAAMEGEAKYAAAKSNTKASFETSKKEKTTLQTSVDANQKEINDLQSKLITLGNNQINLGQKLAEKSLEVTNLDQTLIEMDKNTDIEADKVKYTKSKADSTTVFKGIIQNLKTSANERSTDIDAASSAILVSQNRVNYDTDISKIS